MQPDLQPSMIVLIHKNILLPMSWKVAIIRDIVEGVCLSFQFHVGKTVCFG